MATHETTILTQQHQVLARSIHYHPGVWFRMKGLLGRGHLPEGEALVLRPCNSIHMFFMKFPIDALFCDREHRIVKVMHRLPEWHISPLVSKSHYVIELPADICEQLELHEGDQLIWEPNPLWD